jgi:hypothetical protein
MVAGRVSGLVVCLGLVAFAAFGCGDGSSDGEKGERVDPEAAGFVACSSFARCGTEQCANPSELCDRVCTPESTCGLATSDPAFLICTLKAGRGPGYE